MTIKPDWWIEQMAKQHAMIDPIEKRKNEGVSVGLSSYGYDVKAASDVRIFSNLNATEIDPKQFDTRMMVHATLQFDENDGIYVIIPPHSFALMRSVEYFKIPRNVTGLMTTKSTYARCGIVSPPTVLEAGWEGQITIEISNTTPLPARVYINEGIAQVLFFEASEHCNVSYADRKGKYQGQIGVTPPIAGK